MRTPYGRSRFRNRWEKSITFIPSRRDSIIALAFLTCWLALLSMMDERGSISRPPCPELDAANTKQKQGPENIISKAVIDTEKLNTKLNKNSLQQQCPNPTETPLNPNKRLISMTEPREAKYTKLWVHDPNECYWISKGLIEKGYWEPTSQELLIKSVPSRNPNNYQHSNARNNNNNDINNNSSALFVDIGGNLGIFSMVMAAAGYAVEAFEPMAYNYELFCQSIYENNFQDRIVLHRVAIGEIEQDEICLDVKDSTANLPNLGNFQVRYRRSEGDAIGRTGTTKNQNPKNKNCVPMRRLDKLVSRCPDLVKVDVEGLEAQALRSLGVSKEGTCRPKVIAAESSSPTKGFEDINTDDADDDNVMHHLVQLDYKCDRVPGERENIICKL